MGNVISSWLFFIRFSRKENFILRDVSTVMMLLEVVYAGTIYMQVDIQ